MGYLSDHCVFTSLKSLPNNLVNSFSCGNTDLDEFFHVDYIPYEDELMGKSYGFIDISNSKRNIAAAFTVCNASIHNRMLTRGAKKSLQENVSEEKQNINFPAVLIGRLGVCTAFQSKRIGSEVMNFIKAWFIDTDNKTGCRYLLVDAYNNPQTIKFYEKNGFSFLFSNADSEKKYRRLESISGYLHTRLMYFDLILMKTPISPASNSDIETPRN